MTPQDKDWATQLLALLHELAHRPALHEVLHTVVLRLKELFAMDKVSVVLFEANTDVAFVVVEADQGALDNVLIQLEDYPEVQRVISTGEPLTISDVFVDSLLAGVRQKLKDANVQHRGAVLFPLKHRNHVVGVLFLRSSARVTELDQDLLTFGRLIAAVTSVALGHALEQESLESKQRALLRTQAEAHEEIAGLRQFFSFFERAQDGILVVEQGGRIAYANQAASAALGRSDEVLTQHQLFDLLAPRCHNLTERALRGDAVKDAAGYVDLLALTPDNNEVVLSTAVRQLDESGTVFLSFRDVTELREIEGELRKTKEFLENLIQSSVDAIVAADVDGRVILFNRAAEEMLGFSAKEALGGMNLADAFPPGEFRSCMLRCRSEANGGKGRLRSLRTEMVSRTAERVPVTLSAAMIYEGEQEMAIVCILSDMRERRRMEEKLSQVQRQLQLSERQAVAIELAGTAAHELNQPLTSILGYAAMLQRKAPDDPMARKAIETIYRQTERMADIVRQLGQITSYETKPYVGGSQILDLHGAKKDRAE